MKLPILALTACLLSAACQNTADAPEAQLPERSTELPAPAEKTSERVQPEIRYYEIADT